MFYKDQGATDSFINTVCLSEIYNTIIKIENKERGKTMISSEYGIKFVWDQWRNDRLRDERITFNANNRVFSKYFIPIHSKMLVYVLGSVQQLQGVYEVTGDYRYSGDPRFNVELPVRLLLDKEIGLATSDIKRHISSFNPSMQGISYQAISKRIFDKLLNDLKNK